MVTMTDIAEKAGVSRATVSLVLNGRETTVRISDLTRDRVLQVAQDCGFRRNELMRSAVSGKNRMLGFVVTASRKEAVARMLEGAIFEAEAQNYTVKVFLLQDNIWKPSLIDRCVELRLAGVMALYLEKPALAQFHKELKRFQIPLATLDGTQDQKWGVEVESDDAQAIALAVDHLADLGHQRIGFISGVPETRMSLRREAGFRQAMKNRGLIAHLSDAQIVHGHLNGESSEAAAREMLQNSPAPTAIIGITDGMAMAAIRGVRALGLSLPRDLSVIGYGGMALSEFCDPALTTVVQPFQAIGRVAVRRLLQRAHALEGEFQDSLQSELLPAELLIRASTARRPVF